ncbi:hypothetical protein K488DRAFT_83914 [Vararia minispora EC-137]|uniref:Uncharacterized protein n=1 Tax=Vararia minispora EC-137 TaxID=1314806 RepID=A0ACB8QSM8_9AGAM|nr:hypothetical protein K488DRAFT_83914 [Vararia minispora EC-137]
MFCKWVQNFTDHSASRCTQPTQQIAPLAEKRVHKAKLAIDASENQSIGAAIRFFAACAWDEYLTSPSLELAPDNAADCTQAVSLFYFITTFVMSPTNAS